MGDVHSSPLSLLFSEINNSKAKRKGVGKEETRNTYRICWWENRLKSSYSEDHERSTTELAAPIIVN
jgi:hypothetical protein